MLIAEPGVPLPGANVAPAPMVELPPETVPAPVNPAKVSLKPFKFSVAPPTTVVVPVVASARLAQLQGTGVHHGAAGIGIGARQHQRASISFDQGASAGAVSNYTQKCRCRAAGNIEHR